MPKGVEHMYGASGVLITARVEGSVMPKGVEHSVMLRTSNPDAVVEGSVMPKGVEHRDAAEKYAAIAAWKDQ
jgi:hypothetical protein